MKPILFALSVLWVSLPAVAQPTITQPPANQVVALGGTLTLGVTAAGATPAYQWFKDSRLIVGATNSTLTVLNAGVTNSGTYYVVVTNASGMVISLPALVTVGNPSLLAWGWNNYGQLGSGTTINTNRPINVASNVVAGAAGGAHSLFVKADGTLWAMGWNGFGQLGKGTTISTNVPISVAGNVVAAAAGYEHSLFIKADGTLWAMGYNGYGQLGNGTQNNTTLPVNVASNVVAAAAGYYHSVFVKTDGTLWAMGYNGYGQLGNGTTSQANTPIIVASNVTAVAVGQNHSLFLKTDGTLWAMGQNGNGELGNGTTTDAHTPINVASNVVAVAAGYSHSLFVTADGTLWAIGYNYYGQLGNGTTIDAHTPINVASNVVAVAAGANHSLFTMTDGTLWAMGYNAYGQLGNGTTSDASLPVNLPQLFLANIFPADIANHSLAIGFLQASATVTLGNLNQAYTGKAISVTEITTPPGLTVNLTYNGSPNAPTNVGSYIVIGAISDADYYGSVTNTLVINPNATVMLDNLNQAYTGGAISVTAVTTPPGLPVNLTYNGSPNAPTNVGSYTVIGTVSTPNYVGGATNALVITPLTVAPAKQAVVLGGTLTLGVTVSGPPPAYQWFKDSRLVLGATNSTLTVLNAGVTNSGTYYVVVTNTGGIVISLPALVMVGNSYLSAWGYNNDGELGDGTTSNADWPVIVASNVVAGAGSYHSLFVTANGTLWAMGENGSGELGNGTTTSNPNTTPISVASNVVAVAAGWDFSFFVKADGTLWAMGDNYYGQLGNGTTTSPTPTPINVASNVVAVAAGYGHSLFLKTDGTLWATGDNGNGQLGTGTTANTSWPVSVASNVVAVAAGNWHSLFVTADGTLWAMGNNSNGQLGAGTNSGLQNPTPISIASNVVAVAAGNWHSLFVTADGTLWAMGYNDYGQLGNGTTNDTYTPISVTSNVVAVAAGEYHSLFVKADGTLWAMGDNDNGQLGNGTTSSTSLPVGVPHSSSANIFPVSHALDSLAMGFIQPEAVVTLSNLNQIYTNSAISVTASTMPPGLTVILTYNGSRSAPTNVGSYTVIGTISDPIYYGSVTNTLVINPNAIVTLGNLNQAYTGSAISVTAVTTPPGLPVNLTYNGSPNAPTNVGSYTVIGTVSTPNYVGSATNTLFIMPVGPTNQVVALGGTLTLTTVAGNTGQAYQWFKDSRLILGATNSTLTVLNAGVTNSGTYYVVVTNGNGMIISLPASVAVGNSYLSAWGYNNDGELGDGTTSDADWPIIVASNVVAGAGSYHSLFVTADRTLWAMGNNSYGQLGNGTTTSNPNTTPISVASNVVAVAAGEYHSLFVDTNGTLWAMGNNGNGQLGNGTTINTNLPVSVASNVVAVAAGGYHSLFVTADGMLWAMGYNGYGQLGNCTATDAYTPISVASNVVAVAAGELHSLFMTVDGTLWGMGNNGNGELGNGTTINTNLPVIVAGNVVSVAAGGYHSLFVTADGTLRTMGYDNDGQLGNGTSSGNPNPTPVSVASNVMAVAAGEYHSLFVKADGTLWAMGDNDNGQLGNGTTSSTSLPVGVPHSSSANIFPVSHALDSLAMGFIQPEAVVTLSNLNQIYTGSAISVTAGTTPPGLSVILTYNGSPNAPTNLGSYIVIGTISDPIYYGSVTNTLVINPNATVMLGNLNQAYTGSAISVTAVTTPPGLPVNLTYNGSPNAPTNVGSYPVIGTISDPPKHYGSATNTLFIMPVGPTNQVVALGGTLTLTTVAGNTGQAYQWFKDSRLILGATNSALTVLNAGVADSGTYFVVVTNGNGMIISLPASVAVGNPTLLAWGNNQYGQLGNGATSNTNRPTIVANNVVVGAAGNGHSLFVDTNGTLWAMGLNNYGQLGNGTTINTNRSVSVASNVVVVAAGEYHSLFVDTNGTLWAMGNNGSGALGNGTTINTNLPVSVASNVVAVAAGGYHSLFVKADGTLWAMGYNAYGQLGNGTTISTNLPVSVASNVVAVAAGVNHSLFVTANGTLWAMGYNGNGQLGNGTTISTNLPVSVASNVVAVAAGGSHSLFVTTDGTLWVMGYDYYGQLGNGTAFINSYDAPISVASNVVAVAAGGSHSLFTKTDGTLWAMGENNYGQLGNGTTVSYTNRPVSVPHTSVANIFPAETANHSLAMGFLQASATVTLGNLNQTYTGSAISPTAIITPPGLMLNLTYNGSPNAPTNVGSYSVIGTINDPHYYGSATNTLFIMPAGPTNQVVALGGTLTLATAAGNTGQAYQWFKDSRLILGATNSTLTVMNAGVTNSGIYYVVITNGNGMIISLPASVTVGYPSLLTWGYNKYGQLGNGTTNNCLVPVGVAGNVVTGAGGYGHSLFVTANGALWAMGEDNYGQLGNGTTNNTKLPVSVASNVVAVAAGNQHSLFVKTDGTLWAMGYNYDGELGNGTNSVFNPNYPTTTPVCVASNVVAVAAGIGHSLFVTADGTLWGMGNNSSGQLGNGTYNNTNRPITVASNVVVVAAGGLHSLFVKMDGTLWTVGENFNGQLGNGTPFYYTNRPASVASNVVAVAAGYAHSLFVTVDGTLWAMGYNGYGQLGNVTTISTNLPVSVASNVVAVTAGYQHSLFVRTDGTLWAMGYNYDGELGIGTTVNNTLPVNVTNQSVANIFPADTAYHSLELGINYHATVTLTNLNQIYTGSAISPTVVTVPAGLTVNLTYNGSPNAPTNPGSYTVIGVISDPSYYASATNTLVINPNATVTLGNLRQAYTGGAISVTAVTAPPGLSVNLTYNGSTNAPTNPGSYIVIGAISTPNYCGIATNTLVITALTVTPASQMVAVAGTVTLNVPASMATSYQWFKDSRTILGATNSTLTVLNAGVTNSGTYFVLVTNMSGMFISLPALVTVGNPSLLAWGYNDRGQLGNGTTTDDYTPISVASNVVAGAAGGHHSLFVDTNETLWAMGLNGYGQLGNGTTTDAHTPIIVASNVVAVAAGLYHSLFVKTDGTLWAMGYNNSGQLGNGTNSGSPNPTPISVASNVVAVAAGYLHSLFVKSDGTLWAMGYNNWGQLGNGTTTDAHTPISVASNVVAVAAGYYHSLFVKSDGTLWAMGYNNWGQLGNGTTVFYTNWPVSVARNVVSVAAGGYHSLFVETDGTFWAMGMNVLGQLGNGTNSGFPNPTPISVTSNVVAVAAGASYSLFTKSDGTFWTMGYNFNGQLGSGTNNSVPNPTPINLPQLSVANIFPADTANHSLAMGIIKTLATVTLGNLNQTYTGGAISVTAATMPTELTVNLTYNGSPNAPTNPGSYTVIGTISDLNYYGSATNALVINPNATVTLGNLFQLYTGSVISVTASTTPPGLTVNLTYNGSPNAPTNAGSYTVVGTVTDPNYYGSATNTLVVGLPPQSFTASSSTVSANGQQLILQLAGTPSYPYILQMATNLTPPVIWQCVFTNCADTNGNCNFTVTNLSGVPAGFYRAVGQ